MSHKQKLDYKRFGGGAPLIVPFEEIKDDVDVIMGFSGWDHKYFNQFKNVRKILDYDVYSGIPEYGELTNVPYEYYKEHEAKLEYVYSKLADNKSKRCLESLINQKISGKYSYSDGLVDDEKLEYLDPVITFTDNEVIVDCGGYDGEDTKRFLKVAGKNSKSFIFEVDRTNLIKLYENIKDIADVCTVFEKAVYDHSGVLHFIRDGSMNSKVSDAGEDTVECVSMDEVLSGENVSFIKMDIEGSELKALKGAEKLITRLKPKLVICLYHKKEDIFEIPSYILSIRPDYKLYMRRYHKLSCEYILYAI